MKKIISLLLVLAMALTLVACGGKTKAPAETEAAAAAPAETGKTEVTVIAAEYGGKTRDWWTGFEEKFEAANADIDLVVEVVAWADINVVVDTRNANGQSPDLLNIDAHAKYLEEGLLLPTSEWVSEETFAKFYPGFVAASMDNEGTVWAIPDLASARFLYVNTDILAEAGVEKAPATWDEVRTACEAIKANVADVYALARMKFRGQTAFLGFIIVSQMFAPVVLLIGIYKVIKFLHLTNTLLGLVFINAAFNQAFSIWLLRGTFMSISAEMEQAATIDGCNRIQAMIKILLPVAAPGIVTTLIFIFINAWNEYTVALCLMSTDTLKPITVGINIFNGFNIIEWQYLFASSIVAIIPVVILFMSIEKNLTSGLTAGGVKG